MSTRTAESIAKIARKNPVAARTWWIAGLAAAGAGLVVFLAMRPAKAAPGAPPANQLTPGRRYGLTLACPFALPTPLPTDTASAQSWLSISGATVVSFKQTSPNSVAVEFDYTGPAMTLPPIQAGGATACTTKLADMGASP
jgi:hypothetical protein